MSDKLVDRRDLDFILFEQLAVESLLDRRFFEDHSRETFDMALETAHDLAKDVFWPTYQEFDQDPAVFDGEKTTAPKSMHGIWQAYKEGGWFSASFSYDVGGQQFPATIWLAAMYMFNAGNSAASMYVGQAMGAGHLIDSFGSDELKEKYMLPLYSGDFAGTMALTEPQAGTSLSDITTSATPVDGEDYYIIRGTKRFISSGDHDLTPNIIHPTLARIEGAPAGVKGISLFIVPKYRLNEDGTSGEFNDVLTGGIEHKLGLKGQATATLNFGENGECRGWLLGEPNKGLSYMFQLMNEARLHTGLQAVAQASAAYQHALDYAKERVQGRPVESKDPTEPQIPIIQHAEVRRMLLKQKAYIEGTTSLILYCGYISDLMRTTEDATEKDRLHGLLEILTPIIKAYGSDVAFDSIYLAMQCYGGSGYIEEYPVAQMLRDARVYSVYEGTNEVQAMDLLGRKVAHKQGAYLQALMAEMQKTIAEAAEIDELKEMSGQVSKAVDAIADVTMHLGAIGMSGELTRYISHATPYLRAFSQVAVSWQFLWQAIVAQKALGMGSGNPTFYKSKIATAQYYIGAVLPSTHTICELIKTEADSALNFPEQWFDYTESHEDAAAK